MISPEDFTNSPSNCITFPPLTFSMSDSCNCYATAFHLPLKAKLYSDNDNSHFDLLNLIYILLILTSILHGSFIPQKR